MLRMALFVPVAPLGASLAPAACHPQAKATNTAQAAADSKPDPRGQAYLDANAKKPGVHVLPSGLQYEVVSSGPASGQHPHAGDEVKVNYEGKLVDGTVFDSSYERGRPAAMPKSGLDP